MTRLRSPLALAALLLLGAAAAGWACPACDVGIGDETVKTTLRGYEYSFLFLAALPLTLVSLVGYGVYRNMEPAEPTG